MHNKIKIGLTHLEAVHKRRPQSSGVVQCGHLQTRVFFYIRTFSVFGVKNLRIFWNLWCVRTDKEG